MKSKVGAMRFAVIAIIVSFLVYVECINDFFICGLIFDAVVGVNRNVFFKGIFRFDIIGNIYQWLLKQPGEVTKSCIEMVSSGIFGSAIVTFLIYWVEYRIQLKENIYQLVKIQREYVKKLNEITTVSILENDQEDIKVSAYKEYAENAYKLQAQEEIKNNKYYSDKKKKEILKKNYNRYYEFHHDSAEKYKEWFWEELSEDKKKDILENDCKKEYLYAKVEQLFLCTDFELVSAFYDYREIFEKDIFDIEQLTEEIYFFSPGKRKKILIEKALELDKMYFEFIQNTLESSFVIENFFNYFCRNRKNILCKIEQLQSEFYTSGVEYAKAVTEFEKWYEEIKKNILGKGVNFGKILNHKNEFEIYGNGCALTPIFLKKMQTQNWDYKKYLNLHLKEMNYK